MLVQPVLTKTMPVQLKDLKRKKHSKTETNNIVKISDRANNVKIKMEEEANYELHECVFNGDTKKLSSLLRTHDVTQKDKHGEQN